MRRPTNTSGGHPGLDPGSRNMKKVFVYITASNRNGTLYIGVTSDLIQRIYQHKQGNIKGFTKKYGVSRLVYFEEHPNLESGINREKQLKNWNRSWKISLIEKDNLHWEDLYDKII